MIYFTETAGNKIASMIFEGYCLRMSMIGGGCSGMNYQMAIVPDEDFGLEDFTLEFIDSFKLVVDYKSLEFLQGTNVDFSDGLNGHGFSYSNPNAKRTCGCGKSAC